MNDNTTTKPPPETPRRTRAQLGKTQSGNREHEGGVKMKKRIKTPKIDKARHWLEMDYHTRKHLVRALNAARRAVRLERLDYMDMMDARRDDERITWQGLWQSRKSIDAMQRTIAELERLFILADGEHRPSASEAVADEIADMIDEYEEGRVLECVN